MSVIGELLVEINGDNSGLKKSLNESGSVAKTGIDKLVSTIGLAAIAWKGVDLAMKGIDYNKAAEQAEIAFGVFLGSAESAKNMIEDLRDLAKETPLEFAEVRDAAKRLSAFGIEAQNIIPTMRMLADVSAGLQIPIQDLAYLFGTIKTQGKAMTVDLNQFANRGIPIWEELANVTGKTGTELRKLVEEGKVGFPQVEAAFQNMTSEGGKFFEMAVKQMDSLAGSQSNLNDNFDVWLGNVTSGLTGPLKGLQDWASNWFSTNTAQLKQNGKEWEELFDGIAKATGWGKYNQSVREHWSDVISSMRLTAVEQEKLLVQAIDIAQKYPEIHKKNNGDILKTVSDISKQYGLSTSEVEKILLNVIDVDKASKSILAKDLERGVAGKEILATAVNYDELQKSGAKDAAKFAAERKSQQDNFNAAFQSYSDKFDTFVEKSRVLGTDEEERLKGQIKLRDDYKASLFDMYDKGLISQKALFDEVARVDKLNEKNIADLGKISKETDAISLGKKAISDAQDIVLKQGESILKDEEDYFQTELDIIDGKRLLEDAQEIQLKTGEDLLTNVEDYFNVTEATVDWTKKLADEWKAIQPNLVRAGDEISKWSGHFSGLSSAAEKFGNDALSKILGQLSEAANHAGNLMSSLGRGDYISAAVSGIQLIADAWDAFFNADEKKREKRRKKEREREKERLAAVDDLEAKYEDYGKTEAQIAKENFDAEIAYAEKIGASLDTINKIKQKYAEDEQKRYQDAIEAAARARAEEEESIKKRLDDLSDYMDKYEDASKDRIQLIKEEEQEALATADRLGASYEQRLTIQKYYADQLSAEFMARQKEVQDAEIAYQAKVQGEIAAQKEAADKARQDLLSSYARAGESIGDVMARSLESGDSLETFRKSFMNMMKKMAIEAWVAHDWFKAKFEDIGKSLTDALADGFFSETEIARLDIQTSSLFNQFQSQMSVINDLFDKASMSSTITATDSRDLTKTEINVYTTSDPLTIANALSNVQQSLAYQGVVA